MFQHILVPLDGSVRAEQALPVAARLARASGGSLLLVRVVSPLIDYSGGLSPAPLMTEQIVESDMTEATDYLTAVAARPHLAGLAITTEVRYGLPAQQLSEAAQVHGSDLIVLCSHGRTGLTRWALGSVAHTLVHQSTVPVFVLRQEEALAHVETARPFGTLVPLDGSQLAEAALAPAAHLVAALAASAQGELHLAQVVKPSQEAAEEGEALERKNEASERARNYLAQVTERLQTTAKDLRLAITWTVIREKDVTSALVSLAEHGSAGKETGGRCDLIAISTHGRHGLERWVMGSVTDRLLNTTKLPVLIVRPQNKG